MSDRHAGSHPALVDSVAGLSAGTMATIVAHPLDVIKTRLQLHRSTTDSTVSNSLRVLRSLTSNEKPIRTLYRGLTPNLVGNASSWALFFYFKTLFETQLLDLHTRTYSLRSSDRARFGRRPALSSLDFFLASGFSGLAVIIATNPIWVLKTRMLASGRGTAGAYSSMWAGCSSIWKTEGLRGFYRGLGISCFGVFHGAVQFGAYESMKQRWLDFGNPDDSRRTTEAMKPGNGSTLLFSGLAKVVAGTAMYPQQVVRSRLQTYDADARFGRSIREVISKIWAEEGSRGFYRGLGPNIVRVLPSTWVTFLVYENVRYHLPRVIG